MIVAARLAINGDGRFVQHTRGEGGGGEYGCGSSE
jgi:hypothetical protein